MVRVSRIAVTVVMAAATARIRVPAAMTGAAGREAAGRAGYRPPAGRRLWHPGAVCCDSPASPPGGWARRPRVLPPGGCPEPGDHLGRDPAAVLDLQAVRFRPVAYLGGTEPVHGGPAPAAGRPAGGAGDLAARPGVAGQDGPQFPGVGLAQVDFVVRAI